MPVGQQKWASRLMGLRALAFVLAWPFVIPPAIRFLDRIVPALDIAPPLPGHTLPAREQILAECVVLVMAAALTALLLLTERGRGRPFGTLPRFAQRTNLGGGPGWFVPVASGTLLGAAVFTVMMGGLLVAGAYHMSFSPAAFGATLAETGRLALLFALVGLTEEFLYRGYLQRTIEEAAGFRAAALLTSALYAAGHFTQIDTLAGTAGTVLFAIFACLTLRATGNVWFAIGWHAGWDFTKTAIFGTPDGGVNLASGLAHSVAAGPLWLTGGSAGPDSSVAVVVVYLVLVIVLFRQPSIMLRERLAGN